MDAPPANYTWDFENRLSSVTLPGSGGTVSFKYDPSGRRVYKSSASGTSIFAYDGNNLVEETSGTGAVLARYSQDLAIDKPLVMLRSGTTSFYNADALGSVTSLSNGAGSLAETYTFDSFGNKTASSGSLTNPFQFTGREFDTETGLYFYRARYFNPQAGRFLSEDRSGFSGGINLYAYTMNSPTGWIDPTGLAMSPEECRKLLDDIRRRSDILAKKILKYDPIADGLGGATYSAGGQIRTTVPESHFGQIVGMQINLAIDIYKYQRDCGSGPKLPPCVYEPVYKRIPAPVIPKTMTELQLDEESARYMEKFWTDIAVGGAVVVGVLTAPVSIGGAGAGGWAWLPAFAY